MAAPPRRAKAARENRPWVVLPAAGGKPAALRELAASRGARQPHRGREDQRQFQLRLVLVSSAGSGHRCAVPARASSGCPSKTPVRGFCPQAPPPAAAGHLPVPATRSCRLLRAVNGTTGVPLADLTGRISRRPSGPETGSATVQRRRSTLRYKGEPMHTRFLRGLFPALVLAACRPYRPPPYSSAFR